MASSKPKSFYEVYKSVRKDWNGVVPVTKIYKDKTKYSRKDKHKNQRYNDD